MITPATLLANADITRDPSNEDQARLCRVAQASVRVHAYRELFLKMRAARRRARGHSSAAEAAAGDQLQALAEALTGEENASLYMLDVDLDEPPQAPAPARLIVFEGMDGAGTTTQTRLMAEELRRQYDVPVLQAAQPSPGPIGKMIREMLSFAAPVPPDREVLALLFAADRQHQLLSAFQPVKADSALIVCDRHLPSSLVYQAAPDGDDARWIQEINARAGLPDHTFFLSVSLSVSLSRVAGRGGASDVFEREEAMRRWHERYRQVAAYCLEAWGPDKVTLLDGEEPPEVVHAKAMSVLSASGLL